MTLLFNNDVVLRNLVINRNLVKIKVQKRGLMRAGKKFAEHTHVVTEHKPVTRMFTRAQHTVHYSEKKEENKKNSEPLENWVSPTETVPVSPEVKAKLDKFPVKHPKIVVDKDMADPEKTKYLYIALTHAIPKKSVKEKYEFDVLAKTYLGKDPKQPTKDHYAVVTNRVLTTAEINTVPMNPELTAYLKSIPGYPDNLEKLVEVAYNALNDLTEKNKSSNTNVMETQQNSLTNEVNHLKKEPQLYFPLAQQKLLQIAPTPPIVLSPIKPLLPPVVLEEQKASSTQNIKNLAETPFFSRSSSNSSASGAKFLTNQNNDSSEKHST